jgi:hypothetical protein
VVGILSFAKPRSRRMLLCVRATTLPFKIDPLRRLRVTGSFCAKRSVEGKIRRKVRNGRDRFIGGVGGKWWG